MVRGRPRCAWASCSGACLGASSGQAIAADRCPTHQQGDRRGGVAIRVGADHTLSRSPVEERKQQRSSSVDGDPVSLAESSALRGHFEVRLVGGQGDLDAAVPVVLDDGRRATDGLLARGQGGARRSLAGAHDGVQPGVWQRHDLGCLASQWRMDQGIDGTLCVPVPTRSVGPGAEGRILARRDRDGPTVGRDI